MKVDTSPFQRNLLSLYFIFFVKYSVAIANFEMLKIQNNKLYYEPGKETKQEDGILAKRGTTAQVGV